MIPGYWTGSGKETCGIPSLGWEQAVAKKSLGWHPSMPKIPHPAVSPAGSLRHWRFARRCPLRKAMGQEEHSPGGAKQAAKSGELWPVTWRIFVKGGKP